MERLAAEVNENSVVVLAQFFVDGFCHKALFSLRRLLSFLYQHQRVPCASNSIGAQTSFLGGEQSLSRAIVLDEMIFLSCTSSMDIVLCAWLFVSH